VVAFATSADLASLLKRTFTSEETEWVETLLESSAEYMRGYMGIVYPPVTATFTTWPSDGWVDLPAYLREVTSVTRDGSPLSYERVHNSIRVHCDTAVSVTMTAGLDEAPKDLVGMNCALVAQAMVPIEMELGLTFGGLSSVALDDFKASFASGGEASGLFALTAQAEAYLKNRYGHSAYTTGAGR